LRQGQEIKLGRVRQALIDCSFSTDYRNSINFLVELKVDALGTDFIISQQKI
jgi:hypothetical protein